MPDSLFTSFQNNDLALPMVAKNIFLSIYKHMHLNTLMCFLFFLIFIYLREIERT